MREDIGRLGDGRVLKPATADDGAVCSTAFLPRFAVFCFVLSAECHCNLWVCALFISPREGSMIVIASVPQV